MRKKKYKRKSAAVRPISQRVNYYDSPPMPVNGNIETLKHLASRATGFASVVFVLLPIPIFFFSRRFSNFFLLFAVFEYRPTRNVAIYTRLVLLLLLYS